MKQSASFNPRAPPWEVDAHMRRQTGFSLIELLVVVAIILIIAAMSVPSFMRSKIMANEASAVAAVRVITTAENTYASSYPDLGFACSLASLGPSADGSVTPTAAGLIDSVLASGQKTGYSVSIDPASCTGSPAIAYVVNAVPLAIGQSGFRRFCSDQSNVIHFEPDADCNTTTSSPLQ